MLFTKQKGAALVVSLVILAVVTLIGVAAMQNSSLELKLVASTKDRATAFQAAEAALASVELELDATATAPSLDQLSNNCSASTGCFTDCSKFTTAGSANPGGRCFQGLYNNGQGKANCVVGNKNASDTINPVDQIKLGNFQLVPTQIQTTGIKVLVEFLCFVERPNHSSNRARVSSEENSASNSIDGLNEQLDPLFRLTALSEGDALRSHVVVQTTYRSTR